MSSNCQKNNILPFARYEASIHSISDIILSEKKTTTKKKTSINNDLFFVNKRKNVPNLTYVNQSFLYFVVIFATIYQNCQ